MISKFDPQDALWSGVSMRFNYRWNLNDLISFEWETEHKRDGYFSKGVKDIEKWEEIIKIVKLKNIDLTIKDNNDVLSALGKFKWEV